MEVHPPVPPTVRPPHRSPRCRLAGVLLLCVWLLCLHGWRPLSAHAGVVTAPDSVENVRTPHPLPAGTPTKTTESTDASAPPSLPWIRQEGLAFAELPLPLRDGPGPHVAVVRLSPEIFDFVLCAVGRGKHPPLTLRQWAQREGLTAAINASMYLPDGVTSTGYLREGDYANNSRLARRFGAFFVAGPDDAALPAATIIDRDEPDWQSRLGHYRLVVQNYRLISGDGRILWKPGGPRSAISAVGVDAEGHILFLHCRDPLDAHSFAEGLLRLPLQLRSVMYVEGGGQAGLVLRSGSLEREFTGRSAAEFLPAGSIRVSLPNVLGARPRHATPPPETGRNTP